MGLCTRSEKEFFRFFTGQLPEDSTGLSDCLKADLVTVAMQKQ